MFIIDVVDLSTKNKMLRRELIFLQKSKIQTVGKRKKTSRFKFETGKN